MYSIADETVIDPPTLEPELQQIIGDVSLAEFANIDEDEPTIRTTGDDWEAELLANAQEDSEGGDEEEEDEEEPPVTPAVSRQTASDCADSLLTFAPTHNNPTVVELMCQVKFQLQLEHAAKSTKQTEIADFFNIQ